MASSAIVLQPQHEGAVVAPTAYGFECNEHIQIYITTSGPNPSILPLKVCAGDTIASVKMRIEVCKGFFVKHQRLFYGGRELYRQDALVRDYGLTDGKKVHLVVKLSQLQVVTIKTVNGREHVFQIEKMKSVRDLKNRLSKRAGLAADQQQLVLRGQDLKDEMLIEQLSLVDDAVVHLFLHSTVKIKSQAIGSDIEISATAQEMKASPCPFGMKELHNPMLPPCPSHGKLNRAYPRKAYAQIESLSKVAISSLLDGLLKRVKAGLENRHTPILSPEGSGGAYFMQDETGSSIVGVFKPVDEEPMADNNPRGLPPSKNGEGLKRGTKVGEGALREVAAYILDHPAKDQNGEKSIGFAGVPPTVLIKCCAEYLQPKDETNARITVKIGSLQMFVQASSNCEDMGPAHFPVHEVHKIAVLDIRLANTDRNGGNILACNQGDSAEWALVPIDHGYCLPEKFEDCTFEWLYWPQAKIPFQREVLEYIASLDAEADISLMKSHGWTLTAACARVFRVATMLLKKGAAAGLTPYEIGSMMCRETLHKLSVIEKIVEAAEATVLSESNESCFLAALTTIMDKYIQDKKMSLTKQLGTG